MLYGTSTRQDSEQHFLTSLSLSRPRKLPNRQPCRRQKSLKRRSNCRGCLPPRTLTVRRQSIYSATTSIDSMSQRTSQVRRRLITHWFLGPHIPIDFSSLAKTIVI